MAGGLHDVVPLVSATADHKRGRYCEIHENECIKMYCFDCNLAICSVCSQLETHRTHEFELIENIFDPLLKFAMRNVPNLRAVPIQVEQAKNMMLERFKSIELKVKKRSEEIRQLIDRQESDLLDELQSLKSAAEAEVQSYADASQLMLTKMENLGTSLLALKSKVSPTDLRQAPKDVHDKVEKLRKTYIPGQCLAPNHKFTPTNIDKLLGDVQNFIGHVVRVEDSGNIATCNASICIRGHLALTPCIHFILSSRGKCVDSFPHLN